MKKIIMLFVVMLCFCLTGCGNEYAKKEYDSDEMIAKAEDHYAKESSVFNSIDGGYSLKVSKFNGRETLWSDKIEEDQEIEIDFSFSISEGKAKIVHIDADGNVTTVLECTPDTSTEEGDVTKTVLLKKGENRLKIVGYDCEDVKLEMLFEVPLVSDTVSAKIRCKVIEKMKMYYEDGLTRELASARGCQDIVLKAIATGPLNRNVTVKGFAQ